MSWHESDNWSDGAVWFDVEPGAQFNPSIVTYATGLDYGKGRQVTFSSDLPWDEFNPTGSVTAFKYKPTTGLTVNVKNVYGDKFNHVGSVTDIHAFQRLSVLTLMNDLNSSDLHPVDKRWNVKREKVLSPRENLTVSSYIDLPAKDTNVTDRFHSVALYKDKDKSLKPDYRYFPTTNFNITDEGNKFTTVFTAPEKVVIADTRMSPVNIVYNIKNSYTDKIITKIQSMNYGYGENNFLIGGVTDISNNVETEPPEPVPDPIIHPDYGVYRIVNIVNMVVLPERTPVKFTDFVLSGDLSSFVWTVSFKMHDVTSFNLVKPNGRVVKDIEIDINGTKVVVFVSETSTSISQGTRVYQCNAWSKLKTLAYPYAAKRSHTELSSKTAAQIVGDELTGSGVTLTDWDTTDWAIPGGVYSYQNKTPVGAISELCKSVGGVIIPDLFDNSFKVKPYYPVSPWKWHLETPTRIMNETQFFSIDTRTVPKDNPDAVFVYGEHASGAAVKCVKQGEAGLALLPDVVDKYITTTAVGQERGRVELCKNAFIELIPMSTYVDNLGLIMPHDLIEFNDLGGGTWRGMVTSLSLACNRVGTALVQKITVARYYSD